MTARRSLLALLVVVLALAGTAGAQTDADVGCSYQLAPQGAGAASYTNPLRLDIRDCTYEWDQFQVDVAEGAFLDVGTVTPGFDCAEGRNAVLCVRSERHTGGAFATFRPSCGEGGGQVTVTLRVDDPNPGLRTGAPKTYPCAPPTMRALRPPRRQSLRTALRRGVLARWTCQTACTAYPSLGFPANVEVGAVAGEATIRRTAGGTYSGRVRILRSFRRQWRRRRAVTVDVNVLLRAPSGEEASGSYVVRLLR